MRSWRGGIKMRSRERIVTGFVLLVIGAGAALGQVGDKETDAVLSADAAWMKVYHAKDLAKSVAFCDEEASMLPPNAPIATGKDAIAKVIASDFANGDLTWHANKAGVAHSGDLGYTSGIAELVMKNESGKTIVDKGKFLTVWKKQKDGSCKVLFDMFSSDQPSPNS
jgi:ketosteroid isomerase-like protein